MTDLIGSPRLSRRTLLKAGGLTAVAAGAAGVAPQLVGRFLSPLGALGADPLPNLHWAGTDGWISLPATPAIAPFHPDSLAPDPADGTPDLTTYCSGSRKNTMPRSSPTAPTSARVTNWTVSRKRPSPPAPRSISSAT